MEPGRNSFQINGRVIGPGRPAYIIAELSANHNQNLHTALQLVHEAKRAGADAVKLQTYRPDTITLDCDDEPFRICGGTQWDGKTLYQLYNEAFTPWEWHEPLQREANQVGLDLFSSPFDVTAVEFLESLNVPAYKIASCEVTDHILIKKIAETGKPVIISSGMASKAELGEAVDLLREHGCRHICMLKCTAAYPAKVEDANLSTICDMVQSFRVLGGLSDHTLGSEVPEVAVSAGACIIEKHFTLSRESGSPDDAFSLEPAEFKDMVSAVRRREVIFGSVTYGGVKSEDAMKKFRRSLFVVEDVKKGQTFNKSNLKSIRPGHGVHTKYFWDLLGKAASQDIKRGTPMKLGLALGFGGAAGDGKVADSQTQSECARFATEHDGMATEVALPVRYSQHRFAGGEISCVVSVMESQFLTTGPEVSRFETAFAEFVGGSPSVTAVAVSSGTAALHAAINAIGLSTGDEVIVPPLTFCSTANVVLYEGGTPVFADIDYRTLCICPRSVERMINPGKTKAVMAVDYAGQPCDYDELRGVCDAHGLHLIADASHSYGATYKGASVGRLADISTFSFHAVKNMTTGEGGMVLFKSAALAQKARAFRSHGIDSDPTERARTGLHKYEMKHLGLNYRLTDVQCAIGRAQLKHLASFTRRRQQIAAMYDSAFVRLEPFISLPEKKDNRTHAYHLYVIRVHAEKITEAHSKISAGGGGARDAVLHHLRDQFRVLANVHYPLVHQHPYYRDSVFSGSPPKLSKAERAYDEIISFPIHPRLTDAEVNYCIQALQDTVNHFISGGR